MNGLDVVAVGVDQERGVVQPCGLRAVLLAHARRAVVMEPGLDARSMETVHLFARPRDERDVQRRRDFRVLADDEVRVLRAALALPDRGISSCARTVP